MKKIHIKLIQMVLILLVAVTVVVSSSYAWMVLASSPALTGIQVAVGGGTTILIAPDMTETVDGVTYHYPGHFSDTMQFNGQKSYAYLQDVGGLTPVSTADGVNWFLPTYYDYNDKAVREGSVPAGQLKEIEAFYLDSELEYANLSAQESEKIREGSYLYLDFWVVSPSADFKLRVSTGDGSGGSYVVDLPVVTETETGYQMSEATQKASTAVRIGFLANQVETGEDALRHYEDSVYYAKSYTALRGLYHEPDTGSANLYSNRFTIYEPNCDNHPNDASVDGSYVHTLPVTVDSTGTVAQAVTDRVTAQLTSDWAAAENGAGSALSQRFQAALWGMNDKNMDAQEAAAMFYQQYLQWQTSPYVEKGSFIKRSGDLQQLGDDSTAAQLAQLDQSGATEDVYIIGLEKNVPQRIRMFIWLEGQDIDCVNQINAGSFLVNLELAGSSET